MIRTIKRLFFLALFLTSSLLTDLQAQEHSVAREWNELLLTAIRNDLARPTVHARNLFHISAAMYDAWAAYDTVATPYFLGQTVDGVFTPFTGLPEPSNVDSARMEAISYAAYRLISYRFQSSAGFPLVLGQMNAYFEELGYDSNYFGLDYQNGGPADLGNYIAFQIVNYGVQDGSNEQNNYENQYYEPVNEPLVTNFPGNPDITDPNRWQPLTLDVFIDQSGNELPFNTPPFLSPEWGNVFPFALSEDDLTVAQRDGFDWNLYHDPGFPPLLDTTQAVGIEDDYKWGFSLVAAWSSHLDPADTTMWDISPGNLGNMGEYPTDSAGMREFYNFAEGGDPSTGHELNPVTGEPYPPNLVKRADYARVLAEFWADGPDSETPPGHWFTLLNYVSDHPQFEKRYAGENEVLDDLEWDVKSYFVLGGAMHDAAVTTWGLKGYYDYLRPISAIRLMAEYGQCTDSLGTNYHPAGFPLIEGFVDTITINDSFELQGEEGQHLGKVKIRAWRGPDYIQVPQTDIAGVDWIRAEEWWPYQRPSFVTPNFAGYLSGHSTFSSAAAQVLEMITGSAYFPGGVGEFIAPQNEFLVFEDGPSEDIVLQWATYRDASDQTSLSRIWGGIHPPADDIPGRLIGIEIGTDAVNLAEQKFFIDADQDGWFDFEDCDDNNTMINPDAVEICDNIDNDCNGLIDDELPIFTYYQDLDGDGYGDAAMPLDTCALAAPPGWSAVDTDCDDTDPLINPEAVEVCDNIDNDCNGLIDDELPLFTYYRDADEDGYGDAAVPLDTCALAAPAGWSAVDTDCDDTDPSINPEAVEVCDNIDNDCNGFVDDELPTFIYYADQDGDSYGDAATSIDTCALDAPEGYVTNDLDCDDTRGDVNPEAEEVCDDIDNNCDGQVNEDLERFNYWFDSDEDGYGDPEAMLDTCAANAPQGFVTNAEDCDDTAPEINPDTEEIANNDVDENCDGVVFISSVEEIDGLRFEIFPNPTSEVLTLSFSADFKGQVQVFNWIGKRVHQQEISGTSNRIEVENLETGVYFLEILSEETQARVTRKFEVIKS